MCAECTDVKVYLTGFGGSDETVDIGDGIRAVVADGINVDAVLLRVPCCFCAKGSHASALKEKVAYFQLCLGAGRSEESCHMCPSAGQTAEVNGVEVNHVEDIFHVNVAKVNRQRVVDGA